MQGFELAAGTVIGRDHRIAGHNNQDALCWRITDDYIAAVVCDGCSEGPHSEVGANIGARLIIESITRHLPSWTSHLESIELVTVNSFLERVRLDVLAQLRVLALSMGKSLSRVVNDYFLFTAIGAIATPDYALIFSIGDGVYQVDDQVEKLEPEEGNHPLYLAYGLVETSLKTNLDQLKFQIDEFVGLEFIDSLLIGTDGVDYFINQSDHKMPGKKELVGSLDQFRQDDKYFRNSDMVRRKLTLVNRDVAKLDNDNQLNKENGLLPDDTTLIVIRRQSIVGGE